MQTEATPPAEVQELELKATVSVKVELMSTIFTVALVLKGLRYFPPPSGRPW